MRTCSLRRDCWPSRTRVRRRRISLVRALRLDHHNCGFVSFQQCLATITGVGGRCEHNPRYVREPRREKRSRY